jgi:hypothetical protein
VKIALKPTNFTELLTYDFQNITPNSAELDLNWEKMQFPVKIGFDVDNIVMTNAAQELKSTTGFNWEGFASAANYALRHKMTADYDQALKWADQSVTMSANFTDLNIKSDLLKEMGKTAESRNHHEGRRQHRLRSRAQQLWLSIAQRQATGQGD